MGTFRGTSLTFRISVLLFSLSSLALHAKSPIEHASVSTYAVHIPSGKVLIDENSQKSMVPASCLKVVTTAAALHVLGPGTRFQTHLAYDGKIENGILYGNLYIIGGGDPCLGSNRIQTSLPWEKQISLWAEGVQSLGIIQIEGKVIGDDSSWEKARAVPTWTWEDLGNYYGAGASSLSFHENMYSLYFKPSSEVGEKADILKIEPNIPSLDLKNEVTTGPEGSGDRACIYGCEFSDSQYVRGTVPKGPSEFSIKGAIPNPSFFCADLLEAALKKQNILIQGEEFPKKEKKVFYTTLSPTVAEIVEITNQESVNLYAEHLLKKMGEVSEGEGSTAAGIRSVKKFLEKMGIDPSGMFLADGSGLSRRNLMTAEQLVSLLVQMKKSEFFSVFFDSLPSQKPGFKAKSGSMGQIKGYVGYHNDIAFAILINQCTDSKSIKEKVDKIFSNISNKKIK